MVNIKKLKGKIVEKGYSIPLLAEAIGIDRTTMYRRLADDGKSFTIGEIERIVEVLDLTESEARDIFFVVKVA